MRSKKNNQDKIESTVKSLSSFLRTMVGLESILSEKQKMDSSLFRQAYCQAKFLYMGERIFDYISELSVLTGQAVETLLNPKTLKETLESNGLVGTEELFGKILILLESDVLKSITQTERNQKKEEIRKKFVRSVRDLRCV